MTKIGTANIPDVNGGIMLEDLIKLANSLDSRGYREKADLLDLLIVKLSEETKVNQQQVQVMKNNLDQAINSFAQTMGAIAGNPDATLKLLRYIQKVTSGPIYDALMKAIASKEDDLSYLIKQSQANPNSKGNPVQHAAWITKIVAQAPKLKRYGAAVVTAINNLMATAHPDMTGGQTPEWVANATNYINQSIDKSTALPNPEAKEIIKGLISSLIAK